MNQLKFILFFVSVLFLHGEKFHILHLNDFHGYLYQNDECRIAKIAAMIKEITKKNPPCLVFDAGDYISGSVYANLFYGQSVTSIYSRIPFTFVTFGNHEFDYAGNVLEELFKTGQIPVLSSNVQPLHDFPVVQSAVMKMGQKKIGIMGITTCDTEFLSNRLCTERFRFVPEDTALRVQLDKFRDKKTDFIILLSHSGYDADILTAQKFPGIDLIIGGHSHTILEKPVREGNTVIAQAGSHGSHLGFLKIEISEEKKVNGGLIQIRSWMPEDPEIRTMAEQYRNKLKQKLSEPVGEVDRDLDTAAISSGETEIANFFTDLIRRETKVDICLLNAGGIRKGLKKGQITGEDIYNSLPFDNNAAIFQMTPEQIEKMIMHGLTGAGGANRHGRFPLVSGMEYQAVLKNGNVSELKMTCGGKKLDRTYTVLVPDFLANGGDGYDVFQNCLKVTGDYNGESLKEIVFRSLKNSPVQSPLKDGRINVRSDSF